MSATHRAGKAVLVDADLEELSAWLDGELEPKQDCAMLDRLKHDPNLRAQFEFAPDGLCGQPSATGLAAWAESYPCEGAGD